MGGNGLEEVVEEIVAQPNGVEVCSLFSIKRMFVF